VFTARYGLNPYITQVRSVFKRLMLFIRMSTAVTLNHLQKDEVFLCAIYCVLLSGVMITSSEKFVYINSEKLVFQIKLSICVFFFKFCGCDREFCV
jgi:hypothetical protein